MSKVKKIRSDFPIFSAGGASNSLCYLDNAATTQKPLQVIEAMNSFYTTDNANVSRGIYQLGEQATQKYEQARATVAQFINAEYSSEIVFTRGATESINMIATSWALEVLNSGDEILISHLEHHANILPWQYVASKTGAKLRYIPITPEGLLDMQAAQALITSKTKLIAITQNSNVLGTQVDIKVLAGWAHQFGAKILVDAAQSVAHQPIDVRDLQVDFLVFSGHKMMGPTGIGVLYINSLMHDAMHPYQRGGGMVFSADWQSAVYTKMPHRLEAGTPSIAQAIGLATAIYYLEEIITFAWLKDHEASLCASLIDGLMQMPRVTILGPIAQLRKAGHLVSFIIEGVHAHDVAAYLDQYGICVRAGHHCAQPLAQELKIGASIRVSFYAYNTLEEVKTLLKVLNTLLSE